MAEEVKFDVDSFDIVTTALRELLNTYPGLNRGEEISFSVLDADGGKAMFPSSGAVIQSEIEDVTGYVEQKCLYPFTVVYRAAGLSENRKAQVKEWLDTLGKWLNRQPVTINGKEYRLEEYPVLTGDRKFLDIERISPSYLFDTSEQKTEDWLISIQATYRNAFEKAF